MTRVSGRAEIVLLALLAIVILIGLATVALAAPAKSAPPVAAGPAGLSGGEADSLRAAIEDERRDADEFYRSSPQSPLAAIGRASFDRNGGWLTIGSGSGNDVVLPDPTVAASHARVRVVEGERFRVESLKPGVTFSIAGRDTNAATTPPAWIGIGRFRIRLSYQNAPALIACDPGRPEQKGFAGLAWWPVDFAYRFVASLEPEARPDTIHVESTNGPPRAAARACRFTIKVGKKVQRLAAYRLLEPGVGEDAVSVFFQDATSGKGSYGMGRYLDAEKRADGKYVLDFNRATNPYCAVTPYFNCPVPPRENRMTVAIPAGEAWTGGDHGGGPAAAHAGA
jgi:uncharacterized protein (DUF1684 family)